MTRACEEIEADLDAAYQVHQQAVATHSLAKQLAISLKSRAIAGDPSVSAQELAQADDAAYCAELPLAAKFEAIKPLQAELDRVKVEHFADGFTAQRLANRTDREQAWADLEAAADRWVLAWRIEASHLDNGAMAVGSAVRSDVSPRVARGAHAVIDNVPLQHAAALEPLERLARNTHRRLLGGTPKPMK